MSHAKYLGVDKDAVIQSLKDGEAFIRSLDIGPATDSILDEFNIAAAAKKLAAAQTDKELAQAMRETGAAYVFSRMSDVFRDCAALDPVGKPHRLYQELAAWGAFSGIELADYRQSDYEQDLFRIKGFINLSREDTTVLEMALLAELLEHWKAVQYNGEDEEIESLKKKLFTFIRPHNTAWENELESFFESLNIRERHQLKTMAEVMSGIHVLREQVKSKWPLQTYGIVLENASNDFQEMQEALTPIMDKVGLVLDPYYELDEVEMTGVGAITRDFEYSGFMLVTSRRVAKELADALPDWKVIDDTGKQIMPTQNDSTPDLKP